MKEKILILSSDYTGSGHKSVANSIIEVFSDKQDYEIIVKDAFAFGGEFGIFVSKIYAYVSSRIEFLWKLMWILFSKCPGIPTFITQIFSHKNLLSALKEIKPSLVVSIHPSFNNHVIALIKKNKLDIPFITVVLDLVSISPLWIDKRADFIICATEEGKKKCLELGVAEFKVKVLGFPLRRVFYSNTDSYSFYNEVNENKKPELLLLSGGYGSNKMVKTAKNIINNFDCNLKIFAGRNEALRKRLIDELDVRNNGNIEIYGFVNNIKDFMMSADVIICRGSPNAMLESVACNKPIIVYSCCAGQEEGNEKFIEKNNLGIACLEPEKLVDEIKSLFTNCNERLNLIRRSQIEFNNINIASNYADFFIEFIYKYKNINT